mmetsp:Transcript_12411/g.37867  ORF Transcript_12411/g.37867 Transcript_12411/m.37867 type:complete len:209 (-) Transcript_12411:742-1368(-)
MYPLRIEQTRTLKVRHNRQLTVHDTNMSVSAQTVVDNGGQSQTITAKRANPRNAPAEILPYGPCSEQRHETTALSAARRSRATRSPVAARRGSYFSAEPHCCPQAVSTAEFWSYTPTNSIVSSEARSPWPDMIWCFKADLSLYSLGHMLHLYCRRFRCTLRTCRSSFDCAPKVLSQCVHVSAVPMWVTRTCSLRWPVCEKPLLQNGQM